MKKKRILIIVMCMVILLSSFTVCAKSASTYYKKSKYCTAQGYGELSNYSKKKDWYALFGTLYGKDVSKDDIGYIKGVIYFSNGDTKKFGSRSMKKSNDYESKRKGKINKKDTSMYVTVGIYGEGENYLTVTR